jgi:hypothetical protein
MKIRLGFEMLYDFPKPTPMIMVLGTHFTRASDIIVPDHLTISPAVPVFPYRDGFGNRCSRIVALLVVRFSTFATISSRSGHCPPLVLLPRFGRLCAWVAVIRLGRFHGNVAMVDPLILGAMQ